VQAWDEKIEAMMVGIKPVLDCVGSEPSEGESNCLETCHLGQLWTGAGWHG
jgi:hypothetical protein